ncbi:MAG: hypothetical protein L0226_03770 [Acidobacteria bacterium]|nr:hypothetical protein [Acidobacteriota bacterium]
MNEIEKQVHHKFKIFSGSLGKDKSLGPLADEVAHFVVEHRVAAKSIGIEYLESIRRLIITVGYRDDETPYPIKLISVSLGKVGDLVARNEFDQLERAISEASAKLDKIICHELYITDDHEFLMVFMTHES